MLQNVFHVLSAYLKHQEAAYKMLCYVYSMHKENGHTTGKLPPTTLFILNSTRVHETLLFNFIHFLCNVCATAAVASTLGRPRSRAWTRKQQDLSVRRGNITSTVCTLADLTSNNTCCMEMMILLSVLPTPNQTNGATNYPFRAVTDAFENYNHSSSRCCLYLHTELLRRWRDQLNFS